MRARSEVASTSGGLYWEDSPPMIKGDESGAVTPRRSEGMVTPLLVWIERGLAFQHGAGDGEQTVCDGAQGSGMAVATLAKGGNVKCFVSGRRGWALPGLSFRV
jgi:hypothetical protein